MMGLLRENVGELEKHFLCRGLVDALNDFAFEMARLVRYSCVMEVCTVQVHVVKRPRKKHSTISSAVEEYVKTVQEAAARQDTSVMKHTRCLYVARFSYCPLPSCPFAH